MVRVGVIGATGYSGAETVRIVAGHPNAEVTYLTSTSEVGTPVKDVYPALHRLDLSYEAFDPEVAKQKADLFVLCMPHGQATAFVSVLLDEDHKVIDVSADFRLPAAVYEQWYGQQHAAPQLIDSAVYGLPELDGAAVARASLVANPGCYPTGAILALAPAVARGLIDMRGIVIDSKSGVSGAGRSPSPTTHYCEVADSIKAYNVGVHRHTPEIEQGLSGVAGEDMVVSFTPHLVPMNRGILTNAYATIAGGVGLTEAADAYREFYSDAPFVVVTDAGKFPSTRDVAGTNECHIGLHVDGRTGTLVAISAIDNLVKGAAGQAVQNMNLMYGLDETAGLLSLGRTV